MSNFEIRALAREQMKNRYWMVFIASLVVAAVSTATSPIAVGFLLVGPLSVGLSYYLLDFISPHGAGSPSCRARTYCPGTPA